MDGSAGSGVCTTGLGILRRDGFASMDAGEKTETLITRPVVFTGKHLFINSDAAGGEIRVAVLTADGQRFDLYHQNRCFPVTTGGTIQAVRWAEAPHLSALAGKPVRFRFHVTNAKLYSFWVSPDESGASHGYVAAGGPGFTEPRDVVGQAAYQAAAQVSPRPAGQTLTTTDSAKGWVCVTPYVFDGSLWVVAGNTWPVLHDVWRLTLTAGRDQAGP